ncbi:hypothetical protein [Polaromonas sp.]|jgi:hypothetical protein|uniref:hypothetical protein n=1 Tax=Polaromonas sp. TaxID=1869339 RepID=UPI0037CA7CE3
MYAATAYVFDREAIQLNAYRLICLFYANREIARQSDPVHEYPDGAAILERTFFPREMSHLLITIAIAIRSIDDQIPVSNNDEETKREYIKIRDQVDRRHSCMMFDSMSLREVCNKIIHATTVEPHSVEGAGDHLYDEYMWESWQEGQEHGGAAEHQKPSPIGWKHLSGNIRLGGKKNGKQWWHLLQVPVFVEAIQSLLSSEEQA